MASGAEGSLGLLAWLLLLQLGLGQSPAAREAFPLSHLPSGGDTVQDPGVSGPEPPLPRMPRSPWVPQPEGSEMLLDSAALTSGDSYPYRALPAMPSPVQIPGNRAVYSACGRRPTARIVGGRPSTVRKWPWQVSLQVNARHICGGSLISKWWVITAAHCIYGHLNYSVLLGATYLNSTVSVRIPVEDIVMHQRYSMIGTLVHDIALVLLASPVTYSTRIQPVCLPEKAFRIQTGTECWVTGWGKMKEGDPPELSPKQLQEVELNIIRHDLCNLIFKKNWGRLVNAIHEGTVCAYNKKGGDSCQGDSGGPLVCEFNATWVQVGIVSWGIGCGRKGLPGVYTELSFYKDWVIRQLSGASCWDSSVCLILSVCLATCWGYW